MIATSAFAFDYAKLPNIVKANIKKQYKGATIKILFVTKKGTHFMLIIQTESEKDEVIVTKKGKILSIDEDLSDMEGAEEGC